MKKLIMAMAVAVSLCGCASPWKFGDGKIGPVSVDTVAGAADLARPGTGALIRHGETTLQNVMGVKVGPFGGLPYTTQRQVILLDGTIITDAQIAKIIEILTPVMPAAIVRTVLPADYVTVPVTNSTPIVVGGFTNAPAIDPDIENALNKL